MNSVLEEAVIDEAVNHFLSKKIGNQSIIICGDMAMGKTTLCRHLISSRKDLQYKISDPFGEIFIGMKGLLTKNYDVSDLELLDPLATVFISECTDIGQVLNVMKESAGVLTTFQASSFEEAIQCLVLRAKFEDSSLSLSEWKQRFAEVKPLFVQLTMRDNRRAVTDIVEYDGTVKHIHPI